MAVTDDPASAGGEVQERCEACERWLLHRGTPHVIADDRATIAEFRLFGNDVVVTAALLSVVAFLSAFSGLSFTVQVVTDGTYRDEFFEELLDELRTTLAVRSAYRTMLDEPAMTAGLVDQEH